MAIGVATVLMFFSFSLLNAGLSGDTSEDVDRAAAFGMGALLVPFVFLALAFLSRHRRAPLAVLKSLGMWVVVAAATGLLSIVLGLYLGFGIGGFFSLRADEAHSYRTRMSGLSVGLIYTLVLALISPPLGLFSAGTVPLISVGFADAFAEKRAEAAG